MQATIDSSLITFEDEMAAKAAFAHAISGRHKRWMVDNFIESGMPTPELFGGGDFVKYPLNPPAVVGNEIRVDSMLNQPTRITAMLADLTLQRFLLDRIFTLGGGVSGGAVVYDVADQNELYLTSDVERIAPGALHPIVTSDRRAPHTAEVEKWGGKTYITDEARQRNDTFAFTTEMRKLANTIVRKLNQRAIEVVEAAITANGGQSDVTGIDWDAVVTGGSSQSNASAWPAADFAKVQLAADVDELGYVIDLWIMNPAQAAQLALVYGSAFADVLRSYNLSIYTSNRVTAGTAYALARGQVGQYRVEKPLGTETWRDADGREITWTQSNVRPLMFVQNPFAIFKVTGL